MRFVASLSFCVFAIGGAALPPVPPPCRVGYTSPRSYDRGIALRVAAQTGDFDGQRQELHELLDAHLLAIDTFSTCTHDDPLKKRRSEWTVPSSLPGSSRGSKTTFGS